MHTDAELGRIERFLHFKIPLVRAMGVRVAGYDGHSLTLTAPLSLNHNHIGTAFGGSLAAMATLAGYGLLWLELGDDTQAHVLIAKSTTRFLRPVRGDIRAVCVKPAEGKLAAFRKKYEKKGRAKIALHVTIEGDGGEAALEFEGRFVAVREMK